MKSLFVKEVGVVPYLWRRLAWRVKKVMATRIPIVLPNGVAFPVPRTSVFAADVYATRGTVDWGSEWIMAEYLRQKPGATFVDVGANIGFYSALVSPYVEAIHAFDPDPRNAAPLETLRRSIPCMVFHPLAVSDRNGYSFFLPGPESSDSSLGPESSEALKVDTVSLSSFFKNRRDQVGGIKVDVEGYDIAVLEGAADLLRVQRPLVLTEFNLEKNKPNSRRRLSALVDALGLVMYAIVREDPSPWRCVYRLIKLRAEELEHVFYKMIFLAATDDAIMRSLAATYSVPWSLYAWQWGPKHRPMLNCTSGRPGVR